MDYIVVIPARYEASRLPGKPLLDIAGKPMIQHVHEQACRSGASRVYVATDNERVREACQGFGAEVCMSAPHHVSGTDRIEEVTRRLGLDAETIVVNVQGDEPLMPPALIDQVAADLHGHAGAGISSLYEVIRDRRELLDPNVVKLVTNEVDYALYFSRSPLPWQPAVSDPEAGLAERTLRHLGIYAYRTHILQAYVGWRPSELERLERLEQLRALANGVAIHMSEARISLPGGVDTEQDLEAVRRYLEQHKGDSDD